MFFFASIFYFTQVLKIIIPQMFLDRPKQGYSAIPYK